MTFATLVIPGRAWLPIGAALLGVAGLLLLWSYSKGTANRGFRFLCLLLKLCGVALLAACLLEPLWSGQRARPGANYFAVIADNSQGMQIKDPSETQSRAAKLHDLLTATKPGWFEKLDDNFQVRRYYFDSRLQPTRDFSELNFDGRASAIGATLRTIASRYQSQPLAGVLLLTDGNATDLASGAPLPTGLPPIYPVVIGRDDPIKDISIQRVSVSQTVFEDAPVTVQTDVIASG